MKSPRVSSVDVDWAAVHTALSDLSPLLGEDHPDGAKANTLARLNEATQSAFPNIAASPIPVLLPFDTAAFLKDKAASKGAAVDRSKYFGGFTASNVFFFPGPAGYDASILLQPQDSGSLQFGKAIDAQISASSVIYELDAPSTPEGSPIPELESQFPGIRRLMVENHLRYTFVRFGVPYVVTMMCTESRHDRRLSCRDADKVGIQFLKTLNIVGGAPQHEPAQITVQTIDRPEKVSPTFTYYAPGDLLPGTGMHGQGRPRRSDGVCQNPLSHGGSAVLREFAGLHELGRVRFHRPRFARRQRQGRELPLQSEFDPAVSRRVRRITLILGAIIFASTAILP